MFGAKGQGGCGGSVNEKEDVVRAREKNSMEKFGFEEEKRDNLCS